MTKPKTPKLPDIKGKVHEEIKVLPHNGHQVTGKNFSLSFACFDRHHKYFNLGSGNSEGIIDSKWFLDLLDCLKQIGNENYTELYNSHWQLHPINWDNTNVQRPICDEDLEYLQFRINKSRGRIIGFIIDNVFYIVWLDPHHNLTNSEGYGKAKGYPTPQSEYESLCEENRELKTRVKELEDENKILESACNECTRNNS